MEKKQQKLSSVFLGGVITENPTFRLVLGTCPTMAVTTSALNGLGMGAAATFVLIGSNVVISLLRNFIPDKIRIPAFIVVICTFVTMVQMFMQAFVPDLYASLGMFIPLDLNTPLLIGGLISWFVSTRSKDAALNKARKDRGTLIASGLIAGGALMGVVSAILKYLNVDLMLTSWYGTTGSEVVAILVYVALIAYVVWDSKRAKPEVSE